MDRQIKKKQKTLRKKYPEVHGKEVDWISHGYENEYLFLNVRFIDGKNFAIVCGSTIVTDLAVFSDMTIGPHQECAGVADRRHSIMSPNGD